MIRRILRPASLGLALLLAAPPGFGAAALAEGCLTAAQARQAVESGQAVPLGQIIGQVRAAVGGGQVLPPPQLCALGGRYVYMVNILKRGGQVTRVVVDALGGGILNY